MLKKIIKALLTGGSHRRHFSSSSHGHYSHKHNYYGHKHYKRKSHSFFSSRSFFSS